MSWEVKEDVVDLAEMAHITVYENAAVKTRDGKPVRHEDTVLLGPDGPSSTRGAESGHLTLDSAGKLTHPDGTEFDPNLRRTEMLARLNGMHAAGRAYAKKHGRVVRGEVESRALQSPQKAALGAGQPHPAALPASTGTAR